MFPLKSELRGVLVAQLLGAVFLVSGVGCGTVAGPSKPETERAVPSPPIVKLDQPVSADLWARLNRRSAGTACVSGDGSDAQSPCPDPFGGRPQSRATTKLYAGLRTRGKAAFAAYVVTYRSAKDGKCWDLQTDPGDGVFGLRCTPAEGCTVNCLVEDIPDDGSAGRAVFAAVVPAAAQTIRLTFRSGREAEYALDGPLYPGLPEQRVFVVELGRERLTLLPAAAAVTLSY